MKEKNAAPVETKAKSFDLVIGEHYHCKNTLTEFDAQLVGIEPNFYVFQKSKLLNQFKRYHVNGDSEKLPEEPFRVGVAQIVELNEWLPR